MMLTPKVIVPPESEPLSIEDCRQHLNIQPYEEGSDASHPDDELIMAMLGAAREHCENFLGLSLSRRTLEVALDEFPSTVGATHIELPFGPVLEILSITHGAGSDDTLEASSYALDAYRSPARLFSADSWPTVTVATNTVRIRYIAGYGLDEVGDGEPLPRAIRAAMLLMLGHLYESREDSTEKAMSSIPNGVEALLRPLRVRLGMA